MTISLCTIDWVAVSAVSTTLMTLATLFMLIVTVLSLRQNKKQHNELRRQWEGESRPNIIASINRYAHTNVAEYNNGTGIKNVRQYWLTLENTGIRTAIDVSIKFDKEFCDNISYNRAKNIIEQIERQRYTIKGKDKYQIALWDSVNAYNHNTDEFKRFDKFLTYFNKAEVVISGKYNLKYEYYKHIKIEDTVALKTNVIQMLDYIRQSIDDLTYSIKENKEHTGGSLL